MIFERTKESLLDSLAYLAYLAEDMTKIRFTREDEERNIEAIKKICEVLSLLHY